MKTKTYKSPIGPLKISEENNQIISIEFEEGLENDNSKIIDQCILELEQYFLGTLKTFKVPLKIPGTEFQQKVYKALLEIPYGEIASYKDIAEKVNCPKGYRAVGLANNKNKIPIIIPCHRVVGTNGKLTGYAGGLDKKEFLLNLEKNTK